MRKLVILFIIGFASTVFANLPDIIALVNDKPITKYDFESRKKMVIVLNNIDASDQAINAKINNSVLNLLIEEELLNQHAASVNGRVSKEQLDSAIATIEKRNNMPKGGMAALMNEQGLSMESFRRQIAGEIIKHNIITSLSNSVSVSPSELDVAVIDNKKDLDVEAWIFTARDSNNDIHKHMMELRKRIYSCDKVEQKLYDSFADAEKFDRKLSQMPASTKSVVADTKAGSASSVYKEDGKYKLVFVCKKDTNLASGDLDKIKAFISNKKMSQKATKFFKDMKSKAYIKILVK